MNPVLRVILVALFVGGTMGALSIPVITASDEIIEPAGEPSPEPTPEETETPEPEPTPSPSPSATPSPSPTSDGPVTVVGAYPQSCLRPVAASTGLGLVAYDDGTGVVVATLGSGPAVRLPESAPVDWSPSGRYFVAGSGRVYTAESDHRGRAPSGRHESVWSPTSDCLLVLHRTALSVSRVRGRASPLARFGDSVRRPHDLFVHSDGRRIGFSTAGTGRAWGIVLPSGVTFEPETDQGGPYCAGVPMGLAHDGIFIGTDFIGDEAFQHTSASCSSDGELVIATREPASGGPGNLVLYRRDGSFVQDMTTARGFSDEYAIWGRPGTGVLFVRVPDGGDVPQLWFIPEGGSARDTGLRLRALRSGEPAWDRMVSWSAAQPDGRADQRGG